MILAQEGRFRLERLQLLYGLVVFALQLDGALRLDPKTLKLVLLPLRQLRQLCSERQLTLLRALKLRLKRREALLVLLSLGRHGNVALVNRVLNALAPLLRQRQFAGQLVDNCV